jgi:hypothetical protein
MIPQEQRAGRASVSLLESLIWGREFEQTSPQPSPSSPSSPERVAAEGELWSPLCSGNYLRDDHESRANAALSAIRDIPAPEGLVAWLSHESPTLYRQLVDNLPNRISRAWNAQIPLEEFDALCCEWVGTFRRAVEVYKQERDLRKSEKSL